MKLHLDPNAFRVLIEQIHQQTGYRTDVLEKDYYVTLILEELSERQENGLPAYFKGGTALYKALKTTNRFSEDIDLSVDTRECSRSQNDKRLEQATKKYTGLFRNASEGRTNRSEVITVYTYEPVTTYDADDALQRFGRVKIEATSFTISEPVEKLMIAPMIYDYATDEQRYILKTQYDVAPFPIMTISLERAFIDKLFAAEAYTRRSDDPHRAFEAAKHLYDLSVMARLHVIQGLYANDAKLKHLLNIRIEEEADRLDGIPGVTPQEFTFFQTLATNTAIRRAYEIMQNQYVLTPSDRIPFEDAVSAIQGIQSQLQKCPAWMEYRIPLDTRMKIATRNVNAYNAAREPQKKRNEPER